MSNSVNRQLVLSLEWKSWGEIKAECCESENDDDLIVLIQQLSGVYDYIKTWSACGRYS